MTEQPKGVSRRAFLQGAAKLGAANAIATLPSGVMAEPATPQASVARSSTGSPRPNILYIHSHDSGRFLSPYGHVVSTPNLYDLATQGVLFRHAFSGAPTCSPSRACLATGETAHEAGMLGLVNMGFKMPDYSHHLCHTLHAAGYHTVLAGLQHIAPRAEMIGFDQLLPHKSNRVADVAPAAVGYLLAQPTQPFFMDCGFFETHRSSGPGRSFGYPDETPLDNPNYVKVPFNLPDVPDTRKDIAGFNAEARVLDRGVGAVLQALAKAGLAENTIVISTTDHGIAFPHMKCNLNDNGWGVSLILRGPAPFRGGAVCDALASHIDLFPTLCDFLRIDTPPWCRGKSLLPVLRGEKPEVNEAVFAEVNYHVAYEPKRAVRTQRYKYIKRYDGRSTDVLSNCDWGRSKQYWLAHDWQSQKLESEDELYDLLFDPAEHNNLAGDAAHAAVLQEMQGRLAAWQQATHDPLLNGPIPLPTGARAGDPNDPGRERG